MLIHNAIITGSLLVNGTGYNTGSFSGSFIGAVAGTTATASYVEYNNVANKPALVSGSSQITYSGLSGIPSGIVSGSAQVSEFGIFATTGSNGFNGSQSITGSLTVTGQVVAQTLNVQQVTSSIVYSSGSNIFGNELSNTQQFTGSVGMTGSLTVAGAGTFSSSVTTNNLGFIATSGYGITSYSGATATGDNIIFGAGVYNTFDGIYQSSGATRDFGIWLNGGTINEPKFVVKNGGNVGIGTTGPAQKLQINGPLALSNLAEDFTTNQEYAYPIIYAGNLSSLGNGELVIQPRTTATRSIRFVTRTSGAVSGTNPDTRMIIRWDGNVGIGTTSPSAKLHIGESGAAAQLWFQRTDGYNPVKLIGGTLSDGNGFKITMNSTDAFAISSTGNVGIGTTSPGNFNGLSFTGPFFDVAGLIQIKGTASNGTAALQFGGDTYRKAVIYSSIGTETPYLAFGTATGGSTSSANEHMRITSDGNIGIGTSSGFGYVSGTEKTLSIANSNVASIYLNSTSTGNLFALYSSAGGSLQFYNVTQNNYPLGITSGGNVGIGTTSPSTKLHIRDNFDPDDSLGYLLVENTAASTNATSNSAVNVKNYSGTSQFMQWENYGLRIGSRILTNGGTGDVYFTSGADSVGIVLKANGNVGIGITSPARKLQVEVGSTAQGGQNWSHSNGTVFARLGIVNPGVNNNTEFGSASNNDLVLLTNNSEKMRITTGGDLQLNQTISTIKTSANNSALVLLANPSLVDNETRVELVGRTYASVGNSIYYRANSHIFTRSNASLGEVMSITSDGNVLIPNQPAWSVGLSGQQGFNTNVASTINWNQSSGNDCFIQGGVTLNGTNGRVTVPVAGKYMVFASIRTEATGAATGTNLNIRRNGTTILRHYVGTAVNSTGSFMYIETRPVIINCAANDYIDFQFDSVANDFILSATSNTVVRFGGYLVG